MGANDQMEPNPVKEATDTDLQETIVMLSIQYTKKVKRCFELQEQLGVRDAQYRELLSAFHELEKRSV